MAIVRDPLFRFRSPRVLAAVAFLSALVMVVATAGVVSSFESPSESHARGQTAVTTPNLLGLEQAQAIQVLAKLRLVPVIVIEPAKTPSTGITTQSPAPGTRVDPGTQIVMFLPSISGGGATTVAVPDLVGDSITTAMRRLGALGFSATVLHLWVASSSPSNPVVDQLPLAGRKLKAGSHVTLVVRQ